MKLIFVHTFSKLFSEFFLAFSAWMAEWMATPEPDKVVRTDSTPPTTMGISGATMIKQNRDE